MSQLRGGKVVVLDGTSKVYAVWAVKVGSDPGIAADATVEWGTAGFSFGTGAESGSGKYVGYDASRQEARFYRTSGAAPAVAEELKDGTNTATLLSMRTVDADGEAINPPGLDGAQAGDIFSVVGDALAIQVTGTPVSDQLDLLSNWVGDQKDVRYGVTRDFTANRSYAKPVPNSINAAAVAGRALDSVDQDVQNLIDSVGRRAYLVVDGVDLTGTTPVELVAPLAGTITRLRTVVTAALTGGPGSVKAQVNTSDVVGSDVTIASGEVLGATDDSGAISDASNVVAAGDRVSLVPDGTPSAGTATVVVEVAPSDLS